MYSTIDEMNKSASKSISYRFEEVNKMPQLAKLIIECGGNLWEKDGEKRVYFGMDADLFAAGKVSVYAQPYHAYLDLNDNTLVMKVNALAFDSDKNKYTVSDYKEAYIDYIKHIKKAK